MKGIKNADGKFSQQCPDIKRSYYFQRNCGKRFQYVDIENLLKKQKESRTKRLSIQLGCGCYEKRATILLYLNTFCYICRQTNRHKNAIQIIERMAHEQCQPRTIFESRQFRLTSTKQQHKGIKIPQLGKIQTKQQNFRSSEDYESIKGILQKFQEKDQEFTIPKVSILNIKDDKNDFFMECYYCLSIMKGQDIQKLLNFQWKSIFPEFACLICIHKIKMVKQLKHKQKQKKTSIKDKKNRQNESQIQQLNTNFQRRLQQKNSPLETLLKQKPLYSTRIKQSKFMKMLPDFYTKPEFTYTGKGLPQVDPDIFRGKL